MLSLLAVAGGSDLPTTIPDAAQGTSSLAGLVLLLPIVAAAICGLCAALRVRNRLPAMATVLALAASFIVVLLLYMRHDAETATVVHLFDWMSFAWGDGPFQSFTANFSLYLDGLTLLWMLFVTGLATLIALYASEYMEHDVGAGYCRFFAGVGIFIFSMAALVMADNLVLLYLGWEGVGLASYLLIGYYYQRPAAVAAAKKAFIMNRIGDLGLALAIFLCWFHFDTVEYASLFQQLQPMLDGSAALEFGRPGAEWSAQLIPWFLMLAAFGKSAQFPLYVWLPDAMEGPTPVSALIHAATMVTAGIFLIARTYPVFELDRMAGGDALTAVAWVGGFTALLAATIGMKQYDIKRVMAYSTVSQLGYMFMGLGVVTSFGAAFHVFTHAFFKALLFLCCGAVMHGFAGQLDLRRLSGVRKLPGWSITAWTMLIGALCLAGFPFTAGFFSKDEILAQSFISEGPGFRVLGWIAIATAGMTAYYTFRVWFRVFGGEVHYEAGDEHHGDDHGQEFHPHAPGWRINAVLLVLAAGSLLAALPALVKKFGGVNWVESMVAHSSATVGRGPHWEEGMPTFFGADPHVSMYFVSGAVGIVGIAIAAYLHLFRRSAADDLAATLDAMPIVRWVPRGMERKWWVDEIYTASIKWPLEMFARALRWLDDNLLDKIVDGVAMLPRFIARLFQPLQSGALQGYAATMAGGAVLILAWVVWARLSNGGF